VGNQRPSYRDELAVVDYLINQLEDKLAGRHEVEFLRTLPSDHCQLGVLAPRDPNVEHADPPEPGDAAESMTAKEIGENDTPSSSGNSAKGATPEQLINGSGDVEPYSRIDEPARRPPSSLGCEFLVKTLEGLSSSVQIEVSGRFAFYSRHFPSFEEQRREVGTIPESHDTEEDHEGHNYRRRSRPVVTLIEKFKRHRMDIPAMVFHLDPARRDEQTDQGSVQNLLNPLLGSLKADPSIWKTIAKRTIPRNELMNESAYNAYLQQHSGPPDVPPMAASIRVRTSPSENGLRVEVYLCNETLRDTMQPYRDNYHILADAEISVTVIKGDLLPIELLSVPNDYQYDRRVFAVGRNASVEIDKNRRIIRTRTFAQYRQLRRATSERVSAMYKDLSEDPIGILESIRIAMEGFAHDWQDRIIDGNALNLPDQSLEACQRDLRAFRDEIDRFNCGIAALSVDDRLLEAFAGMNRAFGRGQFEKWHLFQIVFIVTQLPALALREGFSSGDWPVGVARDWSDILDWADVLWFPTGGGKTEAYLGLICCAAIYDRLRGKACGVTAWLRFPLRMLSVQQLQRAIRVLWYSELERQALAEKMKVALGEPISLGYFAGGTNTPNKFRDQWSFENLKTNAHQRDRLLLINDCPACDSQNCIELRIDEDVERVCHVCSICGTELPVYISDVEVFRFLPTLLVGTVDKMAAIAYQHRIAQIWHGPNQKCSLANHGYVSGAYCINNCPTNPKQRNPQRIRRQPIQPYDPGPSIHVQDELHLLQEELGAFAGHYETMIRANESAVSGLPPKIVAATATIEGYVRQAQELYGVANVRRFPNRGYDLFETFYTTADIDPNDASRVKTMRVFAAFRPPHLAAADAATLCVELLHQNINELQSDPYGTVVRLGLEDARTPEELSRLLDYYSSTLSYVGKRDSGIRMYKSLEMRGCQETGGLRPGNQRDLNVEYLSSHSTLREISETVKRLEADVSWQSDQFLDATVATDVIGHGVDVERFNLMILERVPEQIAAYIQISSRSGRRHVGLVISVLPSHSLRANSLYDRFVQFHEHLDRMVTPIPVNRFAQAAVARTFPGIALGTLYGRCYPILSQLGEEAKLKFVSRELRPGGGSPTSPINKENFAEQLFEAYSIGRGIYDPSLEEMMKEVILQSYRRFLTDVNNPCHKKLPQAFAVPPMTSLRDVDIPVGFRPDEQNTDFYQMRWFKTGR